MNKKQRELYGNDEEKLQVFKGRLLRLRSFKNLKPEAKRVAIAQDVIAQLDLEKIVASQGTWLENAKYGESLFTGEDVKNNKLLSGKLAKVKQCEACALGSMFMCAVDLAKDLRCKSIENELNFNEKSTAIDLESMEPYLGKFFEKDQLRLIELAFEGGDGGYDPETDAEGCAVVMFDIHDEAESRMRTIMQNIIDNKGTFVVKVTDALLKKFNGDDDEDNNYDCEECGCSDCCDTCGCCCSCDGEEEDEEDEDDEIYDEDDDDDYEDEEEEDDDE